MLMTRRCDISEDRWLKAVDIFELGIGNGREIADRLGVSAQTVSREMKRRRARKGSRTPETLTDLVDFLDRKDRREANMRAHAAASAAQRHALAHAALSNMIAEMMAAERCGDISLALTSVQRTASSFGMSWKKR